MYHLAQSARSALRLIALLSIALVSIAPGAVGAQPTANPPATAGPSQTVVAPLPGGCGRVTPPGAPESVCCVSGFVFMDGAPIAGAEVEIRTARGDRLSTYTQRAESEPTYRASLSAAPLFVQPGETITVTARYGSHERMIEHVVQPGGQQLDLVLARRQADDYMYGGMITGAPEPGTFKGPVAVAVDRAGAVYVLDRDARQIQVFSRAGELLRRWGSYGSAPGQFVTPIDLAVDDDGNVYVADRGTSRVQKFSGAGVYLTSWQAVAPAPQPALLLSALALGRNGEVYLADQQTASIHRFSRNGTRLGSWQIAAGAAGQLPRGIAVAQDDTVVVIDQANARVQRFTADGRLLSAWGSVGSDAGMLRAPERIAVDAAGQIYISDTGNQRIQQFAADGRWLAAWGQPGTAAGQFEAPQGIAVAGDGTVYVSDIKQRRVQQLSPDGRWGAAWGGTQTLDRTFNTLGGLDIDPAGNVYVTDTGNHRIQKFGPDGRWLASWGQRGSADGQLALPRGIAVAPNGTIYVGDTDNHRIQQFSADGRWLASWGQRGSANGQLVWPRGVAVDPAGDVYVADSGNHRIQKFAADGRWLASWGQRGSADGQLDTPFDVAIDGAGNVLVADTHNHRIQQFGVDGRWLASWGGAGSAPGQLALPKSIAVDQRGHVYVADAGNHRLQKFGADGRWLGAWGSVGSADGRVQELKAIAVDARGAVLAADTWDESESAFAAYTRVYSRLQVFHPMQQAAPIATIRYLPRLSLTPADTLIAHGSGQTSDAASAIQAYRWTSDRDGLLATTADLRYDAARLTPGTHRLSLEVQDSAGRWSAAVSTHILVTAPPDPGWTMLLYLAGDYHDNGSLFHAFSETLERLTTQLHNPYVRVAVQIDGPASGDTQRLLISPGATGAPPTVQRFAVGELAMDDPATLANFVSWGQQKFPADSYYLAVADHGQALTGTAWDHTSDPSGAAYLTPRELGQALADPDIDTIDVLHLDACAMNLLEVAYEVHPKASLLIASQYLGWNFFDYDTYQRAMGATTTPRTVARSITASYAARAEQEQVPYTIAALNLQRSAPTLTAIDNLAAELAADVTNTPARRAQIGQIWRAAQKFESNGDLVINELDLYVDLVDWAERVAEGSDNPAVRERATQLLAELTGAQPFILAGSQHAQSNALPAPYGAGTYIDLSGAHGLSIFYPARADTVVYARYVRGELFSLTGGSRWDAWLLAAVGPVPDGPLVPLPGPLPPLDPPSAPEDPPAGIERRAFLPLLDTRPRP